MAVTVDDVRHVAALARLGLPEERVSSLVGDLNTILGHMDVLASVDTSALDAADDAGSVSMPLQTDRGPSVALAHSLQDLAPSIRDGFLLVPRLATHETTEEA